MQLLSSCPRQADQRFRSAPNVPATEEGGDYVHQYMVILTDYKESVDIGWYQMSSSTDEPDDLVQAGIDEFQNYENQFLKDEDLVRPILMLL